jgi:hypothetical protein
MEDEETRARREGTLGSSSMTGDMMPMIGISDMKLKEATMQLKNNDVMFTQRAYFA